MNHLDDGTLQAFLDDELPPQERASAAEHLLACPQCQDTKDELVRAHSVFSEAVSVLDVDPPGRAAPATRRAGPGRRGGPFVKAAILILLVAAAASAAVPGSPVREWIVRAVEPAPAEAPAPAVEPEPEPAPAPVPARVSLAAGQPVAVLLTGMEGSTLRLVETEGERVTVSAVGAETDPSFRTATGTLEVHDGVGGEITVEWPTSLETARLVVNGELYAEKAAGALRIRVPAETVEGVHIWP
ncbi:MAG: anti-sigma factor family protein [Candidatus Longimicrobiales bacterium M2_2A_002]